MGSGCLATRRTYARRQPEHGALHHIIREHLETFLTDVEARTDESGVPRFVERELRRFLTCGILAHGFARFRCSDCRAERLVAFSCKGRGFCPSCGGRRMTERAAHLVDRILPPVPHRQWVLSLPFALRYRLAFDHDLCRAVLAVFVRTVHGFYRRRARARGHEDPRTGSVTVIQRFGGALNLNPHFHNLTMDGVFTEDGNGELTFHRFPPPTDDEVAQVLETVHRRVLRLLIGRGLWDEDEAHGRDDEEAPPLAPLYAASVRQLLATGPRAGQGPIRLRTAAAIPEAQKPGRRRARLEGFDLHANVSLRARSRARLERLCRYLMRPPLSQDRLTLFQGKVHLTLKTPWRDGSTHVVFEPHELLERLAVLIPRPGKNQLLYHGVLAANAKWRKRVVDYRRAEVPQPAEAARPSARPGQPARANPTWADLMRRGLDIDALECPKCGSRLRFVAAILERHVVQKILDHLGLSSELIRTAPARGPPDADTFDISA